MSGLGTQQEQMSTQLALQRSVDVFDDWTFGPQVAAMVVAGVIRSVAHVSEHLEGVAETVDEHVASIEQIKEVAGLILQCAGVVDIVFDVYAFYRTVREFRKPIPQDLTSQYLQGQIDWAEKRQKQIKASLEALETQKKVSTELKEKLQAARVECERLTEELLVYQRAQTHRELFARYFKSTTWSFIAVRSIFSNSTLLFLLLGSSFMLPGLALGMFAKTAMLGFELYRLHQTVCHNEILQGRLYQRINALLQDNTSSLIQQNELNSLILQYAKIADENGLKHHEMRRKKSQMAWFGSIAIAAILGLAFGPVIGPVFMTIVCVGSVLYFYQMKRLRSARAGLEQKLWTKTEGEQQVFRSFLHQAHCISGLVDQEFSAHSEKDRGLKKTTLAGAALAAQDLSVKKVRLEQEFARAKSALNNAATVSDLHEHLISMAEALLNLKGLMKLQELSQQKAVLVIPEYLLSLVQAVNLDSFERDKKGMIKAESTLWFFATKGGSDLIVRPYNDRILVLNSRKPKGILATVFDKHHESPSFSAQNSTDPVVTARGVKCSGSRVLESRAAFCASPRPA